MKKQAFLQSCGFDYNVFKIECLAKGFKAAKYGSHYLLTPTFEMKSDNGTIKEHLQHLLQINHLQIDSIWCKKGNFTIVDKIEIK